MMIKTYLNFPFFASRNGVRKAFLFNLNDVNAFHVPFLNSPVNCYESL